MDVVFSATTALGQGLGLADQVKNKRLRKLARNLNAISRAAARELAPRRRCVAQPKRQLLYHHPDTLTNADLDHLVVEVEIERWRAASERATQPQLPLQAAE